MLQIWVSHDLDLSDVIQTCLDREIRAWESFAVAHFSDVITNGSNVKKFLGKTNCKSLLYNTGKTDGLTHTLGQFLKKVEEFESCRFSWGNLYWMVNRYKSLVTLRSFVEELLGKRPFEKYAQRHTKFTNFSQPVVGKLGLCVVTETCPALCS